MTGIPAFEVGQGGPSAREIVAIRKCQQRCGLVEALRNYCNDENIFGPATKEHYLAWLSGKTKDDDPKDVEIFNRWREQRRAA